jgi:N6-adenosine-specific RNA methylase IME4
MPEDNTTSEPLAISREAAEEFTQAHAQAYGADWRLTLWAVRQGIPEALGLSPREWAESVGGYIRLSIPERRDAVAELTEGEGLTNVAAAEILGVDEGTIRGDKKAISENSEPEPPQQIETGGAHSENSEPPPEPETPALPEGRFRCILIDPPWPIEKIEREVRPNQGRYVDYHVWTLDKIKADVGGYLNEKADRTGCHIYLWVTHRHLPEAFQFFKGWGVKYQCLMTWKKNVGITPFSWMYDTEHVLFGRIGGLPLTENGLRLWFEAPVTRHSEKPQVFYDRVRAASPEPRLDLFARESHEGFTAWGDEVCHG